MILKNANILDLSQERVLQSDVLLRGAAIAEVAPAISMEGEAEIDCTGCYILPALCDMHVHLDSPVMLSLLLACGITRVRNMWGRPDILNLSRTQLNTSMPSIKTGSPIIDGIPYLTGCRVVTTPQEAREAVAQYAAEGYDFIKTYPDICRDAFFALMEEAARRNLRVAGHGNKNVSIRELSQSGYASLEHASCLPDSEEEIAMLAEAGIWFVPTLVALENVIAFTSGGKSMGDVEHLEYVDAATNGIWVDNIARFRSNERFYRFSTETFARRTRLFAQHSDRILLGSDTPMPGTVAGFSAHRELSLLMELGGFSAAQALRAATVNPARFFGESRGAVAAGQAADLLILEQNPLQDISHIAAIRGLLKDGKFYSRKELDEMLDAVKRSVKSENKDGESHDL